MYCKIESNSCHTHTTTATKVGRKKKIRKSNNDDHRIKTKWKMKRKSENLQEHLSVVIKLFPIQLKKNIDLKKKKFQGKKEKLITSSA